MKSFKHIISYACDKNCSYCCNELLTHNEKQCKDIKQIIKAYQDLYKQGYRHIMLSGGEPVVNKMFVLCLMEARRVFDFVSIISAHKSALTHHGIDSFADDVLFSLHKEYLDLEKGYAVEINTPFYASMVVESYMELQKEFKDPMKILKYWGFKGLTLRQAYPDGIELPKWLWPPKDFSLRCHSGKNCTKDSLLLLPNLSTTTEKNFTEIEEQYT